MKMTISKEEAATMKNFLCESLPDEISSDFAKGCSDVRKKYSMFSVKNIDNESIEISIDSKFVVRLINSLTTIGRMAATIIATIQPLVKMFYNTCEVTGNEIDTLIKEYQIKEETTEEK